MQDDGLGKVFFEDSKGNSLCGILSNPFHDLERPIVILCHGFSSSKESRAYPKLEKSLNDKGIASFRFDFFGHGESEGRFEDVTISEAVDDIISAIGFLKGLGYRKIGLAGTSFGGIASIIAASKNNELFALALRSPVSNYVEQELARNSKKEMAEWKKLGYKYPIKSDGRKLKLKYSFFEDAKKNNGYKAAEKIVIPALIVHGGNDEIVSIEQSKKTVGIIRNCRLEIVKGAGHRYLQPKHLEKAVELITKFMFEESAK